MEGRGGRNMGSASGKGQMAQDSASAKRSKASKEQVERQKLKRGGLITNREHLGSSPRMSSAAAS